MYRGYDIHGMAEKAPFEEVAYLLLNGELPNAKQLKEFTQQIASERGLPGPVRNAATSSERHASNGYAAHRCFDVKRLRQRSER